MRSSLQDAQSAAKALADNLPRDQGRHARAIGDALGALETRLRAHEAILVALAQKVGMKADDVELYAERWRGQSVEPVVHDLIHRLVGLKI